MAAAVIDTLARGVGSSDGQGSGKQVVGEAGHDTSLVVEWRMKCCCCVLARDHSANSENEQDAAKVIGYDSGLGRNHGGLR